jgi:hypothetical protein
MMVFCSPNLIVSTSGNSGIGSFIYLNFYLIISERNR